MPYVRRPITSVAEWLALRPDYVGSSEVSALLGESPYLTAAALHVRKRDRLVDEDNPSMRRGRKLQAVALEILAEDFPTWRIEDPRAFWIDEQAKAISTPDALIEAPNHGAGVGEIKSIEPSRFAQEWKEDGAVCVPPYVQSQIQDQMAATGAAWGCAIAIVIQHGIVLHVLDVPRDEDKIRRIQDERALFWHRVARDELPPLDYGRDTDLIKRLFRAGVEGSTIDLSGDNELPVVIAERELATEQKARAEAVLESCNGFILDRMRQAELAVFAGGIITAKTIHRKEHTRTIAATSYRQIKIKRKDAA